MATPPVVTNPTPPTPPPKLRAETLSSLLMRPEIKERFKDVLKDRSAGFMSSILSLYNMTPQLRSCDPMSIVSSAMIAATLDLPINSNLGFAAIVPYGNLAQFQMMWRGFVQLAIRTGKYKTMNASEVFSDELKMWNPITGELELTDQATWKERYMPGGKGKVIGYSAFFKLSNGFEKYWYLTVEELMTHGKKYSKSFQRGNGRWVEDFGAMAKKTVLKGLLSKYGILSIDTDMQNAMKYDQAVVKEDRTVEYPDAIETEPLAGDDDAPKEMPNDAQEPEEIPKEEKPTEKKK